MHFVTFTRVISGKKVAIPVDSIVYFEESTIDYRTEDEEIEEKDCVKIEMQKVSTSGIEWVKVSEKFHTVYDRIKEAKKKQFDFL